MALSTCEITGYRLAFALTLLVVTYFALTPTQYPVIDRVSNQVQHLAAFAVLALLFDFSYSRTGFSLTKTAWLLAYGLAIECVQYFLPVRSFQVLDLVTDAVGISFYVFCRPILRRLPLLRRRWTSELP